jgi:NAD(P)-dependent dehydrogenase (short-subunit alcohol dehydrogenase family)
MNRLFDLNGKIALVVRGHGGFGKVIALGFTDAGADVVVASRNLAAIKIVVINNHTNEHDVDNTVNSR